MGELADRIRPILADDPNTGEMRMFGGTCFLLNGNMLIVARGAGGLMARVGREAADTLLSRPGVERMVMRGREMADYVTVSEDGMTDEALRDWISMSTAYVGTLPPKQAKPPSRGKPKD